MVAAMIRVLVACELSGVVRDAFAARGHYAVSCDIESSRAPESVFSHHHHQGDVLEILHDGWDLMIAHPPCTYLSSSGLHWNKRVPGRDKLTDEALEFVRRLMAAPIPKICIENPVGCIGTRIDARDYGFSTAKATQWIQPHQFGNDASKQTGLWLKGLPALEHTTRVSGRIVEWPPGSGKLVERWANQTDSGQNRLGPSDDRAQIRSTTYPGIAQAMAEQWG